MNQQGQINTARNLLDKAQGLLVDFDGPVCSVFSGVPAHVVADQLRAILIDDGHDSLPGQIAQSSDPFEVLRYSATLGIKIAEYVEAAFTAHEVEAIASASPTPGSHDLLRNWHESGRALAIVSNNSVAAINAYLDFHDLGSMIDFVSARSHPDPKLLKPSTHLLRKAVEAIGVGPRSCVLIGDSITDIQAAQASMIPIIAFANKPAKQPIMLQLNPDSICTELSKLT